MQKGKELAEGSSDESSDCDEVVPIGLEEAGLGAGDRVEVGVVRVGLPCLLLLPEVHDQVEINCR